MLLRRLRGIGVAMIIWSILGMAFGIGDATVEYFRIRPHDAGYPNHAFSVDRPPLVPYLGGALFVLGIWGAFAGFTFAVGILAAERNQTLAEASVRRFAAWGACAAMLLPGMAIGYDMIASEPATWRLWRFAALLLTGIIGAVCAVGMLRVARRGIT